MLGFSAVWGNKKAAINILTHAYECASAVTYATPVAGETAEFIGTDYSGMVR